MLRIINNRLLALLILGLLCGTGNRSVYAGPLDPVDGQKAFQNHIRSVVKAVKAAETPAEKRALLNESFDELTQASDKVAAMKKHDEETREGLLSLKAIIVEKQDELMGRNGFSAVPDAQLNDFADYVQQSLEQADRTITLTLTSALLIVIILILLL